MTAGPADGRAHFPAGWRGLAALGAVVLLTLLASDSPSALTRTTIHLALLEYAAALWLMMGMSREDWQAHSRRGRLTRWLWSWALITFLVHVACAFHFTHHWSHGHAVETTQRESGFGAGVYVNYLFMALWAADVSYWWLAPSRYGTRSRWIDRGLHGFMIFIAFNATVVFEGGLVRTAGAAATSALLMRWIFRRTGDRRLA